MVGKTILDVQTWLKLSGNLLPIIPWESRLITMTFPTPGSQCNAYCLLVLRHLTSYKLWGILGEILLFHVNIQKLVFAHYFKYLSRFDAFSISPSTSISSFLYHFISFAVKFNVKLHLQFQMWNKSQHHYLTTLTSMYIELFWCFNIEVEIKLECYSNHRLVGTLNKEMVLQG